MLKESLYGGEVFYWNFYFNQYVIQFIQIAHIFKYLLISFHNEIYNQGV